MMQVHPPNNAGSVGADIIRPLQKCTSSLGVPNTNLISCGKHPLE